MTFCLSVFPPYQCPIYVGFGLSELGSFMSNLLFIGLGGFVGATLRYVVATFLQGVGGEAAFPLGTLGVNLIGCFVIGLLAQLALAHDLFSPQMRLFVFVGFLGSFTTYSTFGNETVLLAQDSNLTAAFFNVALHLLLGFGAVVLGQRVAAVIGQG